MWQLAVLTHVLHLYPERLSDTELELEMLAGERAFAQLDAFRRAVRGLVADGLLRHDGDSIVGTHAAMRFAQLHDS
jgi:hypothetical protein